MTAPPSERILRLNTVLDRTGFSRATLYRKVQADTFPKQIRFATSSTGWRESAINDWLRNPMFWSIDDGSARQSDPSAITVRLGTTAFIPSPTASKEVGLCCLIHRPGWSISTSRNMPHRRR